MLNRRLLYQDGYWAIEADIPEHLDRNEPLPTEAERASICGSGNRGHEVPRLEALLRLDADRGEPQPKVIQARLVHATITETMDTHGHLFPDVEDLGQGAIDAISAVALTEQGRNQDAN
jgi:hypothetical protein